MLQIFKNDDAPSALTRHSCEGRSASRTDRKVLNRLPSAPEREGRQSQPQTPATRGSASSNPGALRHSEQADSLSAAAPAVALAAPSNHARDALQSQPDRPPCPVAASNWLTVSPTGSTHGRAAAIPGGAQQTASPRVPERRPSRTSHAVTEPHSPFGRVTGPADLPRSMQGTHRCPLDALGATPNIAGLPTGAASSPPRPAVHPAQLLTASGSGPEPAGRAEAGSAHASGSASASRAETLNPPTQADSTTGREAQTRPARADLHLREAVHSGPSGVGPGTGADAEESASEVFTDSFSDAPRTPGRSAGAVGESNMHVDYMASNIPEAPDAGGLGSMAASGMFQRARKYTATVFKIGSTVDVHSGVVDRPMHAGKVARLLTVRGERSPGNYGKMGMSSRWGRNPRGLFQPAVRPADAANAPSHPRADKRKPHSEPHMLSLKVICGAGHVCVYHCGSSSQRGNKAQVRTLSTCQDSGPTRVCRAVARPGRGKSGYLPAHPASVACNVLQACSCQQLRHSGSCMQLRRPGAAAQQRTPGRQSSQAH